MTPNIGFFIHYNAYPKYICDFLDVFSQVTVNGQLANDSYCPHGNIANMLTILNSIPLQYVRIYGEDI